MNLNLSYVTWSPRAIRTGTKPNLAKLYVIGRNQSNNLLSPRPCYISQAQWSRNCSFSDNFPHSVKRSITDRNLAGSLATVSLISLSASHFLCYVAATNFHYRYTSTNYELAALIYIIHYIILMRVKYFLSHSSVSHLLRVEQNVHSCRRRSILVLYYTRIVKRRFIVFYNLVILIN